MPSYFYACAFLREARSQTAAKTRTPPTPSAGVSGALSRTTERTTAVIGSKQLKRLAEVAEIILRLET